MRQKLTSSPTILQMDIVPAKFGVYFFPCMINVPKQTKLHLNEIVLFNIEFCKSQIQLRQPPISWKIYFSTFCNRGVRVNATATCRLCILCKYACTLFRGYDINTHMYIQGAHEKRQCLKK